MLFKCLRNVAVAAAIAASLSAQAASVRQVAPNQWMQQQVNGVTYGWYSYNPNVSWVYTRSGWIPAATYLAQLNQQLAQLQAQQRAQQQGQPSCGGPPLPACSVIVGGGPNLNGGGNFGADFGRFYENAVRNGAVRPGASGQGTGGFEQPFCINANDPTGPRIRCR